LRVVNLTADRITVSVQSYSQDDQARWLWYPADPRQSTAAKTVTVGPGETQDVQIEGWRLNASKARIWARSEKGSAWNQFKDKDLLLVPEQDKDGNFGYFAPDMQTFTFTIR
jgi:hypothetical protein